MIVGDVAWITAPSAAVDLGMASLSGSAVTETGALAEVNQLLLDHGFELNLDGGAIKGSAADRLEQSSTRAEPIAVEFADGVYPVPSCYYEFAHRYPLPSGELFAGIVPASADKLFQSTDAGPQR